MNVKEEVEKLINRVQTEQQLLDSEIEKVFSDPSFSKYMSYGFQDKYAEVYWTIEDLNDYDIPEHKKHLILELIDEDLRDRMIQAGWDYIYEYMANNNYPKKEKL